MTPADKLKDDLRRQAPESIPADDVELLLARAMSMGWPSHKRVREFFGQLVLGIEPEVRTPAERLRDSVRQEHPDMRQDSFDRLWQMAMEDGWPSHERVRRVFAEFAAMHTEIPETEEDIPSRESIDSGPTPGRELLCYGPGINPVRVDGVMVPWDKLSIEAQFGQFLDAYEKRAGKQPSSCYIKVGSRLALAAERAGIDAHQVRNVPAGCAFFPL